MKIQLHRSFNSGSTNNTLFVSIFFVVFLFVVITATLVTFIQPETFQSTARLHLPIEENARTNNYDPVQIEIEILRSELVLGSVIQSFNLNSVWGKRYAGGQPLHTQESLELLRKSLRIVPIRSTTIVEVQAFSDRPDEAAMIANAVTKSYQELRSNHFRKNPPADPRAIYDPMPLITDIAPPPLEPVRPNKAMNITLGCVFGIVLGTAAGILVVALRKTGFTPQKRL